MFWKRGQSELIPFERTLDRGKSRNEQINFQGNLNDWEFAVNTSLKEIQHYKTAYDKILLGSDFSHVWYYIIKLSNIPEFLCSGTMAPEYDFHGRKLQNLLDFNTPLDLITFTIIVTDGGGAIVFSWINESNAGKNLVRSLHSLSHDKLPDAMARLTFEHFQNVYASPNWWDGLDEVVKRKLLYRQSTGTLLGPERSASSLLDDGLSIVRWDVVFRDTNISL